MKPILWSHEVPRLGTAVHSAKVGGYRVASVTQPLLRKNEAVWHQVNFYLPGISISAANNHYTSVDDAKAMAEVGIRKWFLETGGRKETE